MHEIPPPSEWGDQDSHGIDLAKLRYNLSLSDDEKVQQHQRAARFMLECLRAADRAGVRRPRDCAVEPNDHN